MRPRTKVTEGIVVEGGGLVNGILEPLVLGRAAEAGVVNVIMPNIVVAGEAIMVHEEDLEEDLGARVSETGIEILGRGVVDTEEDRERGRYFSIGLGRHRGRGKERRHNIQGGVIGIGQKGVDLVWTEDLASIVRGRKEREKERGSEKENAWNVKGVRD